MTKTKHNQPYKFSLFIISMFIKDRRNVEQKDKLKLNDEKKKNPPTPVAA